MPKISALTSLAQASVDTAADVLPIVDATAPATTKKVTVQAMVNAGLAAAAPQGGIFALTGALTVSGQSSFTDGTAAAPSVKVGAEQNGLYSSAANTLDVTLGGVRQASFAFTSGAVDHLSLTGSSAAFPGLYAVGASTNVNMLIVSKGTGGLYMCTNSGTVQALFSHTASAVNYPGVTGSVTGAPVSFFAAGSDSNIDFAVFPKGTGVLRFGTHSALAGETVTGYITIKDSSGTTRKLAVVS